MDQLLDIHRTCIQRAKELHSYLINSKDLPAGYEMADFVPHISFRIKVPPNNENYIFEISCSVPIDDNYSCYCYHPTKLIIEVAALNINNKKINGICCSTNEEVKAAIIKFMNAKKVIEEVTENN